MIGPMGAWINIRIVNDLTISTPSVAQVTEHSQQLEIVTFLERAMKNVVHRQSRTTAASIAFRQ
jgi:hypothetical protein